ncbi:MAG: response regulator transcription factor [Rhodospirillaceae bacterium]|nr:response regulator transcription factor [Rhodospirillaceae bacterium]
MATGRTIGIIDDDAALRDSLALVLRFRDFDVVEFGSGEELLASPSLSRLDCMILDLRMGGMGGLEVVESCRARGITAPIIVVTAFGSIAAATRALKSGAFDFLEKPVLEDQMIRVLDDALSRSDRAAALRAERNHIEERLATLSGRERQVLEAVLDGRHNREIAAALNLSVRTIEVYKARVMEKMRVSRLAELIRLFARLEPAPH